MIDWSSVVVDWPGVAWTWLAWLDLAWPRRLANPPSGETANGRKFWRVFVLNIGSKDALGKQCQNQHDGMKVPTLCHISLPVLRTGSG
ncbi:hypothetical protein ACFOY8_05950 [Thalassospira xianhensis]|uniref:hypothetical protein n=1 Tax=Thalassospira xianhensis TaxID=478503 RepID=UPI000DED643D|nr:hypothetical protein [Thalassospira xianhensis]